MEAVKQCGRALEYAAALLKLQKLEQPEVLMEAVKQSGRALEHAAEELKLQKLEQPEVLMELDVPF